ncbi:galactose oxidase [Gigaspora margarita]|uniref:Galactose oxidase n=1 Tax=Gigaspora margarita TaxID=4874 RepID=A0A8H4B2U0_GIGMA|nr:galactose oxidase [Gigaspora margarita]
MEDVSKQFTTTYNVSIPWVDLTYTGGPLKTDVKTCIGGKNNDMIFIFGGWPLNGPFISQFDTSKQQWINITSVNREDISCTNFNNGLVAIFSGMSSSSTIPNDRLIFKYININMEFKQCSKCTSTRFGYCAITLPDEKIFYILVELALLIHLLCQ